MWESLVSNKGLMGWDRFFFIFFNWIKSSNQDFAGGYVGWTEILHQYAEVPHEPTCFLICGRTLLFFSPGFLPLAVKERHPPFFFRSPGHDIHSKFKLLPEKHIHWGGDSPRLGPQRHMPRWRDLSCHNQSHQQHRWGGSSSGFLVGFGFQTLEVVTKIWFDVASEIVRWWRKKRGLLIDGGENLRSIRSFPACHTQLFQSHLLRLASTRRTPPNSRVLTCMARCRLEGGWGNRCRGKSGRPKPFSLVRNGELWLNHDPSMFCLEWWESITFHVLYVMCIATVYWNWEFGRCQHHKIIGDVDLGHWPKAVAGASATGSYVLNSVPEIISGCIGWCDFSRDWNQTWSFPGIFEVIKGIYHQRHMSRPRPYQGSGWSSNTGRSQGNGHQGWWIENEAMTPCPIFWGPGF